MKRQELEEQAQRLVDALARGNMPDIADALRYFIYVIDNYHHIDNGFLDAVTVSFRILAREYPDEHPIPFDDTPFYPTLVTPSVINQEPTSAPPSGLPPLPECLDTRELLALGRSLAAAILCANGAAAAQMLRHLYAQMFHYGALRDHATQLYWALESPLTFDEHMLHLISLPCLISGPCLSSSACQNVETCSSNLAAQTIAHPEPKDHHKQDHYAVTLGIALEQQDPIEIATALRLINHHIFVERLIDTITWANLDRAIKAIITHRPPDPSITGTDP